MSTKHVIFFLDDDAAVLNHFRRAAFSAGHASDWDIRTSESGYSVSELLRSCKPDVCVLDWDYGKSDSADASDLVRRIRLQAPAVPILQLTQYVSPKEAQVDSGEEVNQAENVITLSKSDATLHRPTPYAGLIAVLEQVLQSPNRRWTECQP